MLPVTHNCRGRCGDGGSGSRGWLDGDLAAIVPQCLACVRVRMVGMLVANIGGFPHDHSLMRGDGGGGGGGGGGGQA